MKEKNNDLALESEIERARRCFYKSSERNPELLILLLVDPIQAFLDAGANLSNRARRYIRTAYPGFPYNSKELYQAVKNGKRKLPCLKNVRIHRPEVPEDNIEQIIGRGE